jgi:hypothetical protein
LFNAQQREQFSCIDEKEQCLEDSYILIVMPPDIVLWPQLADA